MRTETMKFWKISKKVTSLRDRKNSFDAIQSREEARLEHTPNNA